MKQAVDWMHQSLKQLFEVFLNNENSVNLPSPIHAYLKQHIQGFQEKRLSFQSLITSKLSMLGK